MVGPFQHEVLARRWRLERVLGEGGMGAVLLANDLTTQRPVAIKRLAPTLAAQPDFVTRFQREARMLATFDHPSLVRSLAVDLDDEGVPFLVMTYVEGKTLDQVLHERTRLSVRQALPLLDQLCDALDYLHARGVVHRDLKPGNLMVDADDRLTVLDFGISHQRNAARLTTPGMFIGTPLYCAPEQIVSDDCTPAADLYALALITWHVLVGDHPFSKAETPADVMMLQVHTAPTLASRANPAVPTPVAKVIDRSLDKEPSKRHPTARAFFDDLVRAFGLDGTEGMRHPSTMREGGPIPSKPAGGDAQTKPDGRLAPTRVERPLSGESQTQVEQVVERPVAGESHTVEQVEPLAAQSQTRVDRPLAAPGPTAAPSRFPLWPVWVGLAALAGLAAVWGLR